jgi:outer membrane protein TolC
VTEWNEIERRPLTPEVIAARIELRVAELRVLAARTSILAARAHHVPQRYSVRREKGRSTRHRHRHREAEATLSSPPRPQVARPNF